MKKQINFILALTLSVFLISCAAITNKKTPLTKTEYNQLVSFARSVINRMPKEKLSVTDKDFVTKTQPSKIIRYNGYKQGKVTLSWKFDSGKQIKYLAEGPIMDFQSSFKGIKIFNVKISNSLKRR
jgi:hypothetical protein